jgi:hypothetical protein
VLPVHATLEVLHQSSRQLEQQALAQATASNPVVGSTGGAASSSKKNDASGMTFGSSVLAGKVLAVGFTVTALLSGMGMILL